MFSKKVRIIALKQEGILENYREISAVECQGNLLRLVFGLDPVLTKRVYVDRGMLFPEGVLSLLYYSPLAQRKLLFFKERPIEITFPGPITYIQEMNLNDYRFLEEVIINSEMPKGIYECSRRYGEVSVRVIEKWPDIRDYVDQIWHASLRTLTEKEKEAGVPKEIVDKAKKLINYYQKKAREGDHGLAVLVENLVREGKLRGYLEFISALGEYGSKLAREQMARLGQIVSHHGSITSEWKTTTPLGIVFGEIESYLKQIAKTRYGEIDFLKDIIREAELKKYQDSFWR